jgi:hypothetical protein
MAGMIALLHGYSFGKLGAKYPSGSGLLEYVARGCGVGHFTGVTRWLTYSTQFIVTAMVAVSFGWYVSALFTDSNPVWAKVFAVLIVLVMAFLNVVGTSAVNAVQGIIVRVVIGILVVFSAVTLVNVGCPLLAPSGYPSLRVVFSSVALTFFAFLGFGVITFTAKDLPNPSRQQREGERQYPGSHGDRPRQPPPPAGRGAVGQPDQQCGDRDVRQHPQPAGRPYQRDRQRTAIGELQQPPRRHLAHHAVDRAPTTEEHEQPTHGVALAPGEDQEPRDHGNDLEQTPDYRLDERPVAGHEAVARPEQGAGNGEARHGAEHDHGSHGAPTPGRSWTVHPDGRESVTANIHAQVSWTQNGEDFVARMTVNYRFTDKWAKYVVKGTGVGSLGTRVRFDEVIQAAITADGFSGGWGAATPHPPEPSRGFAGWVE